MCICAYLGVFVGFANPICGFVFPGSWSWRENNCGRHLGALTHNKLIYRVGCKIDNNYWSCPRRVGVAPAIYNGSCLILRCWVSASSESKRAPQWQQKNQWQRKHHSGHTTECRLKSPPCVFPWCWLPDWCLGTDTGPLVELAKLPEIACDPAFSEALSGQINRHQHGILRIQRVTAHCCLALGADASEMGMDMANQHTRSQWHNQVRHPNGRAPEKTQLISA
jgi:hypothetical protein